MFVDKAAYLKRIGYGGSDETNLENLVALHRGQSFAIPFENFDVHLKGDVALDKEAIFDKLVYKARGGYCYEVNGLFFDALQAMGYQVQYLTSRPMLGYTEKRPKSHMILKVDLGDKSYLCDLGFTGMSLIEPLEMVHGATAEQYGFAFRVIVTGEGFFQLQSRQGGDWVSLYEFDLQHQLYIDFKMANHFNATSPDSICTRKMIASRYTPEGRIHLLENRLRFRGGEARDIEITDKKQFAELLQLHFNIVLSPEDLDLLYARLPASSH